MSVKKCAIALLFLAVLGISLAGPTEKILVAQEKGGGDTTGPYEVVPNWPMPVSNDGYGWGSIPAVFAESPNRVFVFMRGELPAIKPLGTEGDIKGRYIDLLQQVLNQSRQKARIQHLLMIFDSNGKLVDSWEQHNALFTSPHRVQISPYDPQKAVWLIDASGHQIFKMSNDGKKILLKMGEKDKPGNDKTHFNQPSDMAFMPNGDFYVTDGYKNTRVVKFDKDGNYLMEWGKPGTGPSEFNTVHGIAIDAKRRLYVSDRENARIQVFDENGKFIEQWPNIPHPYFVYMSKDQHVWVGDGLTHKILKFDLNGKLLYSWGTFGVVPGSLWGPHQLSVDTEGNLYVANAQGNNVVKFRPKKGADPAKLIGQPYSLPMTSGQ